MGNAGVVLLRGGDGSKLRITIDGPDLLIEVDADGNGSYEGRIEEAWGTIWE